MKELIPPNCKRSSANYLLLADNMCSLADLTDINVFKKDFDDSIFPGMNKDAEGHGGFLGQHAKTANTILSEVERLI